MGSKQLRIIPAALLSTLILSPAIAQSDRTFEQAVQDEGLQKVNLKADLSYVKPGVDWQKFRTIYLMPLVVPDEVRDASPSKSATRDLRLGESYVLRDKEVNKIKSEFDRIMRREITRDGRYKLVDSPQADSLIVATHLADIVLRAPIEDTRANYSARGGTYSEGGGTVTIHAAFADGSDGTVIARVIDQKVPQDTWQANNSVTNLSDLGQMYGAWGRALCKRLGELQAGKTQLPGGTSAPTTP